MNVWVCRTGLNGQYENIFFDYSCICLTRENMNLDLSKTSKEKIIKILYSDNPDVAKQTISNTWSQIDIFANKMCIGDIVIIPKKKSYDISVGVIESQYRYEQKATFPLIHTRKINLIAKHITTTDFPKDLRYSLGAFRSIFGIRQVEMIISELRKKGVVLDEISI